MSIVKIMAVGFVGGLVLFAGAVVAVVESDQNQIDLLTITQITPTSNDVTARIDGLAAAARDNGLQHVMVVGDIKKKVDASDTAYDIRWSGLEVQVAGRTLYAPITDPLESGFTGPGELNPDTSIPAFGSLSAVSDAFSDLQQQQKELEDSTLTQLTVRENNRTSQGSDPSPSISASGPESDESGGEGFDLATFMKTDKGKTTAIACDDRVDFVTGFVYPQSRQEEVDGKGAIVSSGTCEDTGQPMPIFNSYPDICGFEYDPVTDRVYQAAIPAYTRAGVPSALSDTCKVVTSDPDAKSFPVVHEACSFDHDLVSGVSRRRERILADIGDGEREFYPCHPFGERYTQIENGCGYQAYDGGFYAKTEVTVIVDGDLHLAKPCSIDPTKGSFDEVLCATDGRYHISHDDGYAYPKKQIVDADEVVVQGCVADKRVRFEIKTDKASCADSHDDPSLELRIFGKRYFNGIEGELVPIDAACEEQGRIPYASGSIAWESSSDWVELKPTDTGVDHGFRPHTVDGVELSTPDDFTYEWFDSKTDRLNHPNRTDERHPLGCFYHDKKPYWVPFTAGDDGENVFFEGFRTCDLIAGHGGAGDSRGGWAKLTSIVLVKKHGRGDGSIYKLRSKSQQYENVLGGVPPVAYPLVDDYEVFE